MAEGDGILHARCCDCVDRDCGDCDHCGGGAPADAFSQDEGCWWREGKEWEGVEQEDSVEEGFNEDREGVIEWACLLNETRFI